jgi:hypothetical protein
MYMYMYHWLDTSVSGLLVPECIIRLVVSVSALTCTDLVYWIYLLSKFTDPKYNNYH